MSSPVSSILGPVVGLGSAIFGGDQKPAGYNQISNLANELGTQSGQLMSYINTGTLPPGLSGQLKQAGDAAKASTKSMYAAHGMSGGSSELTDLGNIDTKIAGQSADIAMSLLQTGISEAGEAAGLYGDIMQESIREDTQLSNAISGFASAAGGFFGGGGSSAGTAGYTDAMGGYIPGIADTSAANTGAVSGYTDALGGQIPGITATGASAAAGGGSLWDTLASAGSGALAFLGL